MSNQETYKKICGFLDAWEIENSVDAADDGTEGIGFSYGNGVGRASYVISHPFPDDKLYLFVMGYEAYGTDGDKQVDEGASIKIPLTLNDFNSRRALNVGQTGKLMWDGDEGADHFVKYLVEMPEAVYSNPASIKTFLDEASDYFTLAIKTIDGDPTVLASTEQAIPAANAGSSSGSSSASVVTQTAAGAPATSAASSPQAQQPASVSQPETQATTFGGADASTAADPKKEKWAKIGWGVLSFCLPIVGLVLYFVWKKDKPELCKTILSCSIAGFVFTLFVSMMY